MSKSPNASPPRAFRPSMALSAVVGSMVGSGVLTTSGYILLDVGSPLVLLLLWVAGGLIAMCGALTLAELASGIPVNGGDYAIVRQAYGPAAAFVAGWVTVAAGFAAPIAASASAAATYGLAGVEHAPWAEAPWLARGIATLLIVGVAIGHVLGRRWSERLQVGTVVLNLVILTSIAVVGWWAGRNEWTRLIDGSLWNWERLPVALLGLVYVSYSYTGWNGAAYLAGEIEDASRVVPNALWTGCLLVAGLYVATNSAFALGVSQSELRAVVDDPTNRVGVDAVKPVAELALLNLIGERATRWASIAMGMSLLASLSAFVLTGGRVVAVMARDGHLPTAAGRWRLDQDTGGVPTWALVTASLAMLWSGSFESLLVYAGLGLALVSLATVGAIFVMRSRPGWSPRHQMRAYPFLPFAYLMTTSAFSAAAAWERPVTSAVCVGSLAVAWPLFEVVKRIKQRARPES